MGEDFCAGLGSHGAEREERAGRPPADAAMCYLKADFLVTTDDGFVWSFRGTRPVNRLIPTAKL